MKTEQSDVIVVGAGPVGLAAAIVLNQNGRRVIVVDDHGAVAHTSRAAVVHARTLELLEPYGVTKQLVDRGAHTPHFTIRDRDRVLVPVPFEGLPTPYPYTLMISQADTETYLLKRFGDLGGEVLRPAKVTEVIEEEAGVAAVLADGRTLRASYLIGADGVHSTVREAARIPFTGSTYDESFVLADVRLSGGVPRNEVILYFSPAGMVVVAPLPDGVHRIVATVPEAPAAPGSDFVQELLDTRGPEARPTRVAELVWSSRFRVHHRVADRFRKGRLLLAGDAAHVHSPAGGQGMNLGIGDAVTLGEALSEVLAGGSTDLLDSCSVRQRDQALEVLAIADRLTRLATARAGKRRVRNVLLGLAGRVPAVQRRLARNLSGLERRE